MFWKTKSVEDIVKPLTTIVDKLQEHADHHQTLAVNHEIEVARRREAAALSRAEASKADTTAEKIAGLIGLPA